MGYRARCWMTSPIPPQAAVRGMTVWQPRLFTLTARLPCLQIQAGGALPITTLGTVFCIIWFNFLQGKYPYRRSSQMISFADPHWFPCGSGYREPNQCDPDPESG